MANDTLKTESDGSEFIWIYVCWICFFVTTALPNLLLAVSVVRFQALRRCKEYLIVGALCFSDAIDVTCYMGYGVHRLLLMKSGLWSEVRSLWYCLWQPHIMVSSLSGPCHSLMLLIISLDRLYCVSCPVRYVGAGKTYAYRMISLAYVPSFLIFICNYYLAFLKRHDSIPLQMPCFFAPVMLSVNELFAIFYLYIEPFGGIVSVVVYVAVWLVYSFKSNNQVADPKSGMTVTEARKRQKKLTKSLAISSVCTAAFLVLPLLIAFTGDVFELPRKWLQPLWLFPPLNPTANVIIFYMRQPHLRAAVQAMVKHKPMPNAIGMWNKTNTISHHHQVREAPQDEHQV